MLQTGPLLSTLIARTLIHVPITSASLQFISHRAAKCFKNINHVEEVVHEGQRVCEKSLYLLLNFVVNLKLLIKIKLIVKNKVYFKIRP